MHTKTGKVNVFGERVPLETTTVNSYGVTEAASVNAGTVMIAVLPRATADKSATFLHVGSAMAGCLHVQTYVSPWSVDALTSGSRDPEASSTMGELYATILEVPPAIIAVRGDEMTLMSKVLDVVCAELVVTKHVSRTCK